jgi:hypothetical protein
LKKRKRIRKRNRIWVKRFHQNEKSIFGSMICFTSKVFLAVGISRSNTTTNPWIERCMEFKKKERKKEGSVVGMV